MRYFLRKSNFLALILYSRTNLSGNLSLFVKSIHFFGYFFYIYSFCWWWGRYEYMPQYACRDLIGSLLIFYYEKWGVVKLYPEKRYLLLLVNTLMTFALSLGWSQERKTDVLFSILPRKKKITIPPFRYCYPYALENRKEIIVYVCVCVCVPIISLIF